METQIDKRIIGNKAVYIFEDHHSALIPWAELRAKLNTTPLLVSFDYHTDTHRPFQFYSYHESQKQERNENKSREIQDDIINDLINKIDYRDTSTLIDALKFLRNDEHIQTALRTNIIQKAIIFSYQNSSDSPASVEQVEELDKAMENHIEDYIYYREHNKPRLRALPERPFHYPNSDIYMPSMTPSFNDSVIDDELDKEYVDMYLEDIFLEDRLNVITEMTSQYFNNQSFLNPYILDIDLDYFMSKKAITPIDYTIFSRIVQNADIITIAKESGYVEICRKEEDINSEYLLEKLLSLIDLILNKD